MKQEDKELLLKDLCARLPYSVKVCIKLPNYQEKIFEGQIGDLKELTRYGENLVNSKGIDYRSFYLDIKPYLRPMSSMTEEEKKDILQSLNIHGDIDNEGNLLLGTECNIITLKVCKKYLGELNKRMFDVCHMIEKGLALEAKEGMYNFNKN